MKKALLYLAVALLAAGCAHNIELTEPLIVEGDPQTEFQPMTRSLEGAVYNEVTGAWMVPQADPYTLENFQRAYDKLATGRSTQTLSKSIIADFIPAKKLAPTHYALKIYPKTDIEPVLTDESGMCITVVCLPTARTNYEDIVVSPLTITYSDAQLYTGNTSIIYGGRCRQKIVNMVGTAPNFSDWIDDFDYWVGRN